MLLFLFLFHLWNCICARETTLKNMCNSIKWIHNELWYNQIKTEQSTTKQVDACYMGYTLFDLQLSSFPWYLLACMFTQLHTILAWPTFISLVSGDTSGKLVCWRNNDGCRAMMPFVENINSFFHIRFYVHNNSISWALARDVHELCTNDTYALWYYHISLKVIVNNFVLCHDDVIKWEHFPCYWPFVRRIHRSTVNFPHKGQWRGALMFSLICVWIYGWVKNHEAGDLRRHRAHCDVTVM